MTSPDQPLPADPRRRLWDRVQAAVVILFCLELGVVLVGFPWSSMWDQNYFFSLAPRWAEVFASSYLRGAVSGLGFVNLWVAVSEAWRLRSG